MQESDRCPVCRIGKLIEVEKGTNHTVVFSHIHPEGVSIAHVRGFNDD